MTDLEIQLNKINEKLKDLKWEAKEDCSIDKTDPYKNFNTMILEKWIRKKIEWVKLLRAYEDKRRDKYRSLYEYYRTDFNMKLSTKEEYQLFIESDTSYLEYHNLSQSVKEIVNYIDAVIDAIKNRAWEIKNFIDYQKFINGV